MIVPLLNAHLSALTFQDSAQVHCFQEAFPMILILGGFPHSPKDLPPTWGTNNILSFPWFVPPARSQVSVLSVRGSESWES